MTIRHFQIFKAVCDSDGITAAAERLNITQPSVSIAIKELEAYYNTKLFDRISRKIYLTEEGTILRRYVESVLEQYEEAELILRNGKTFSKCKLGVNISFAETHLPSLVTKIREVLPDCALQIAVHNNEYLEHMLTENQVDFAIYDGTSERSSKNTVNLLEEDMVLLCSPLLYSESSITLEALSTKPLLLREEGSGARSAVNKAFLAYGLPQKIILESASTLNLLTMAKQALGFTFIPFSLAKKECESGELKIISIQDKIIRRTYYLAHNEHKHLTKTMQTIKELICHLT